MNGIWNFPNNNWAQRQGISETGIELFKGKPVQSLAREICQNSLDAGLKGQKVIIEFSLFNSNAESFPGREDFEKALNASLKTWQHQKSKKTIKFIENAITILKKETIRCLRISDYNTTGTQGSDQNKNTPWNDLIKSAGSSDKNATAGGSFGIGKFATFACSELRTVFYSTIDIDEIKATQGVSRLVSFIQNEITGEETTGVGYYGIPDKNRPLNHLLEIDPNHKRSESGTDIFIFGFIDINDWVISVIDEILNGFLYAIYMNSLEVKVDNIVINKDTLHSVIEKYRNMLSSVTISYYEVLISENTKWSSFDVHNMGELKIGLLYGEDWFPRSVSMIRNPWMKIYDQNNISNSIPFAGVCIVKGLKLNEYLRQLENPQHTAWEPDRLEKKVEIDTAKVVLKDIRKLIKKEFEKFLKDDNVEQVDIEGAGDLIPFEDETNKDKPNQIDPLTKKIQHVKIKKTKNIYSKGTNQNDFKDEEIEEMIESGIVDSDDLNEYFNLKNDFTSKTSNITVGDEQIEESENQNTILPKIVKIDALEMKLMCLDFDNSLYRLALVSEKDYSNCRLQIYQLDDQGNKKALLIIEVISSDNNISWHKNQINNFNLEASNVQTIDFRVESEDYFSAEVQIYGLEK